MNSNNLKQPVKPITLNNPIQSSKNCSQKLSHYNILQDIHQYKFSTIKERQHKRKVIK